MLPSTFLLFLFEHSCEGSQMGDLVAVMGMEMTEGAFLQLITDNVSSFNTQCLAQNHHLVLKVKERVFHVLSRLLTTVKS